MRGCENIWNPDRALVCQNEKDLDDNSRFDVQGTSAVDKSAHAKRLPGGRGVLREPVQVRLNQLL